MKKILSFEIDPPFKTYTFWAHYLGIWYGTSKSIEGFLFNKFTIISYFMFFSRVGYTSGYHLRKKFKSIKIDFKAENCINVIKKIINQNKYAIIILDRNKISYYDLNHCYRDFIIYGYDDEQQFIYGAGYIWDKDFKVSSYSKLEIEYSKFIESLLPHDQKNEYKYKGSYLNNRTIWINKDLKSEEPNKKIIKRKIFCLANHILMPWNEQHFYRIFYKYNSVMKKKLSKPFDIRPLKTIFEHKRLLLKIINYYLPNSLLCKKYEEIYKLSEAMVNTAVKYNFKLNRDADRKREVTNKINQIFIDICTKEPAILKEIYKEL